MRGLPSLTSSHQGTTEKTGHNDASWNTKERWIHVKRQSPWWGLGTVDEPQSTYSGCQRNPCPGLTRQREVRAARLPGGAGGWLSRWCSRSSGARKLKSQETALPALQTGTRTGKMRQWWTRVRRGQGALESAGEHVNGNAVKSLRL